MTPEKRLEREQHLDRLGVKDVLLKRMTLLLLDLNDLANEIYPDPIEWAYRERIFTAAVHFLALNLPIGNWLETKRDVAALAGCIMLSEEQEKDQPEGCT